MREKYTFRVGSFIWSAYCDDSLGDLARQLLQDFATHFTSRDMKDGARIRFGFSVLIVRFVDWEIRLKQPNFNRDPFQDEEDDITTTLLITAEQVGFHRQTRTDDRDDIPPFYARMVARKGALEQEHIYLRRQMPSGSEDSGWFLGLVEEADRTEPLPDEAYQGLYVFELLHTRPALLRVLGLPAGSVVVFRGDQIEEAVDERGRVIWSEVEDQDKGEGK